MWAAIFHAVYSLYFMYIRSASFSQPQLVCKIMEHVLLEDMSKHIRDREAARDRKHGFTKRNPCLTNLVFFHNGETASMDKGRAAGVICIDFCKAFDMVQHNILVSKLKKYGFKE